MRRVRGATLPHPNPLRERVQHARAPRTAQLESEIAIHRSLDHPYIVRFVNTCEDELRVYMVLEKCTQRTLHELMRMRKRLSEREAARIVLPLVHAVRHLHERRVIHRDIKLSNLFVHESAIKLADFGLAVRLADDSERRTTLCGTPNYIAPEVLQRGGGGHSYPVDVWSIGVVLYALLVGRPPFSASGDVARIYARIKRGVVAFPETAELSAEARELIGLCLQPDAAARPSLAQVARHPFVRRLDAPPTPSPAFYLKTDRPELGDDSPVAAAACGAQLERAAALGVRQPLADAAAVAPDPLRALRAANSAGARRPAPCAAAAKAATVDVAAVGSQRDGAAEGAAALPRTRLSLAPALCSRAASAGCVARWCDFSARYGVGWELLDGTVGANFNDSSRLVLSADKASVEYHPPAQPPSRAGAPAVQRYCASDEAASQVLGKKLKLLRHFETLLQRDPAAAASARALPRAAAASGDEGALPHVRRTVERAGTRVFRLSNSWLQLVFDDGAELLAPLAGAGALVHASGGHVLRGGEYAYAEGAAVPAEVAQTVAHAVELLGTLGFPLPPSLTAARPLPAANRHRDNGDGWTGDAAMKAGVVVVR
jgi:polo-like kinase 1